MKQRPKAKSGRSEAGRSRPAALLRGFFFPHREIEEGLVALVLPLQRLVAVEGDDLACIEHQHPVHVVESRWSVRDEQDRGAPQFAH